MSDRAPRVRFIRLSYLIWLLVPIALVAMILMLGTPHLRWSYAWRDDGQGFKPFADRFYLRCTYLGPTHHFTIHHPVRGHCPLIRFAKAGSADSQK